MELRGEPLERQRPAESARARRPVSAQPHLPDEEALPEQCHRAPEIPETRSPAETLDDLRASGALQNRQQQQHAAISGEISPY